MLLYKSFQTISTELLLASTPNPTWIEEKRPKSGFSTSIILRHYHWEILKLSILLKKKSSIKKYWKGPLLKIESLSFIELLELKRLTNIDRYFLMSHENWNCLNHIVLCMYFIKEYKINMHCTCCIIILSTFSNTIYLLNFLKILYLFTIDQINNFAKPINSWLVWQNWWAFLCQFLS